MKRHALLVVIVALVVLARTSTAEAVPITYTQVVTASGSLGPTSFTDAVVTLELIGDTTTVVVAGSGIFYNFGPMTVDVDGVGTATFTGPDMRVVDNPSVQGSGFSDFSAGKLVLFTRNAAFASYDLTNAIGPLTGQAIVNLGSLISTDVGDFTLTSINGVATFSSRCQGEPCSGIPNIPEPGNTLLIATGALSFIGVRVHRNRFGRRLSKRCS